MQPVVEIYAYTFAVLTAGAAPESQPTEPPRKCGSSVAWNEVRPIFELHCYRCHGKNAIGSDAKRAASRLDMRRLPFAGGRKNVLESILTVLEGPRPQMPPDGPTMQREQLKTLIEWARCSATPWPSGRSSSPKMVVNQFHEALARADRAAAVSLLAPSVIILRDEMLYGFDLDELHAEMRLASSTSRATLQQLEAVSDSTASVLSLYAVEGVINGAPVSKKTRELVVLQLTAKRGWVITHIHQVDVE